MNWKNIFRGTAMGMVETVPGVSSSTIAMLLGIYGQIISAINDLTSKRWKRAMMFLIPVGIGMIIGFIISIQIVKFFLDHYMVQTHYFFIGLVVGMLPFIWREGYIQGKQFSYKIHHYVVMLFSFIFIMSLNLIPEKGILVTGLTIFDYIFLFASGWLASVALVLPGISGTLILLIVGAYHTAITAVLEVNIPIIAAIALGIVCGILMTSKFVKYMLENHLKRTYSFMIGLIAGSITILYPGVPQHLGQMLVSVAAIIIGFMLAFSLSKRKAY